jgi:endonuclease/exonuclease/phosphatase (EEP) superfamily protein YafD
MEPRANPVPRKKSSRFIRLTGWYLGLLLAWFLLFVLFGDGAGYLGLLNAVALFLFFPLPIALWIAWRAKSSRLLLAGFVAVAIFAWLWGPLFLPVPSGADVASPTLRVMTFNILGRIGDPHDILSSIRSENADVIFLQELTPEYELVLSAGLEDEYPYQILKPVAQAAGMGVFSRYPIEPLDVSLDGRWRGEPQLLRLDWQGEQITLVNFHAVSTGTIWPRWVRTTFDRREESIGLLAAFAADSAIAGPVIVAGDGNLTRLNDTYKVLDAVLDDAWWHGGWGFGHTFPGKIEPDDMFTRISIFLIPHWLVRIDYVFYSDHWQTSRAWLADFNGGSDHRGVVTDLVLITD